MSLGDLQACPWCPFVGPPRLFDVHYATMHERDTVADQDTQILGEVYAERRRQDAKWGEQNHADGTGDGAWTIAITPGWGTCTPEKIADLAKQECSDAAEAGQLTFLVIAREEIAEAFAETDPDLLRAELVQSAAVLVNWIGAIDRRKGKENDS